MTKMAKITKHMVATTINGDLHEFICEPDETLLEVLRDRLGMTGSKEGCGTGDCGACSVMLDNRLVCSCLVLGAEADGAEIETIEGMAEGGDLHPLQEAFLDHAALQWRDLHAGHSDRGAGAVATQPRPERRRGALLAGREPVPLHRL